MKRRWLLLVIGANLLVLLGLAFVYPQHMVAPGPVIAAHAEVGHDCFACHAPWRGAAATRCTGCHAVADIGLRSSQGQPLAADRVPPRPKVAFHQKLREQDCMACHSDHSAVRLTQARQHRFTHALLQPELQAQCESCHSKPADRLHRGVQSDCQACHRQDAWKPATFDHTRQFVLDRDHDTDCATCHQGAGFASYTCYGCHEHTPANIRAEHEEEGIRDFRDCASCHRDPQAEPRRR